MIQILVPSIRDDISGMLDSLTVNTTLPYTVDIIRTGNSYAEAVNSRKVEGDWVMFAADDVRFYPAWDTEAMKCHERTGKLVIGTNDLHNKATNGGSTATHWLAKKEYFDTYGGTIDRSYPFVYDYHHNYIDAEFIETAKYHDQFISCPTSVVEHLNPSFQLAHLDPVYEKSLRYVEADKAMFESRKHLWSR